MYIRYIYDFVPHYTTTKISYNKVPVACVIRDGDNYGIAVKNPCDKRFIKKRAVQIAKGRASKYHDLLALLNHYYDTYNQDLIPNSNILVRTKVGPFQKHNNIFLPFKQVSLKEAIDYAICKLQRIKNKDS